MNRNMKYSVVVPLYNEAANVTALYVRLTQVMEGLEDLMRLSSSTTAVRTRRFRLSTKSMKAILE